MSLVTTAGSSNANAYLERLEASEILSRESSRIAQWDALEVEAQENAIRLATSTIDGAFSFDGRRTNGSSQALAFPRAGLVNREGYTVDAQTIPDEVVRATAHFALDLALRDRLAQEALSGQGFRSIKVGSIQVEVDSAPSASLVPPYVVHLLAPFGELEQSAMLGSNVSRRIVRR